MRIITLGQLRPALVAEEVLDCMRAALIAQSRGECETPMPMHLNIAAATGEVHIKSSYRQGGEFFAVKMASTFPGNAEAGLATGSGMMLLASARTGQPVALLQDEGYLTDYRTAAVAAMAARELGRRDRVIGVLGAGIQAHLSASLHARALMAESIVIWARRKERAEALAAKLREECAGIHVKTVGTPVEVERLSKLIVTCTAAREPLLLERDLQPGTHVSAIGSDSHGKQELDPAILRRAALVLADSRRQCEQLGELQHTPDLWGKAVEIGDFCRRPRTLPPHGITVADFTGLGVEDLYIAEYAFGKVSGAA